MTPRIPWDAPSRYGRSGLLARRVLQRVLRPLTVRIDAEHEDLRVGLTHLHEQVAGRLADLELGLQDAGTYGSTVDSVLDAALLRDLPPGTRTRRVTSGDSSRAICSLATGDAYRALLARSALSYERYARRWGWDLVLSTEDFADGRPPSWSKIPLLRSLMDQYEWVLWLDADVVIVDLEADIGNEIRSGSDLYLTEHHTDGGYTANAGVMLIRSTDWARSFLDDVWARADCVDHPWWENAAILELLGYSLTSPRLVRPTTWLRRTRFLDVRWNSIEIDRADRPAFVHRGFFDAATRIRQVSGDLACTLRGAHPLTAGWDRPARPVTSVGDVHRRAELPLLLNSLQLTGTGVELGVRKGHFSEHLLAHWAGNRLISIDSWAATASDEYVDISNVTQDEHDGNHAETNRRLARFGKRSTVWRTTGDEARARLRDESLDFVYLDARHDRESVAGDLALWWPAVRPGGLMAGHDYLDGELPEGIFGVRSAVDEFFGALGLRVQATTDEAPWPSWMVIKPGEVGPPPGGATSVEAGSVTAMNQALAWLARRAEFTVVQIGAYTGDTDNDPLYGFLSKQLPAHPRSVAVLVEPVGDYFERLKGTYAGLPQVRLENAAIAESAGERDFFRIAVDPTAHGQADWLTQLGSLREDRMTTLWERYEQQLLDREGVEQDFAAFWHANRVVERVRCMTVEQLLTEYGLSRLDMLQIDAEGYDYAILRTLDFSRIRPRFINYERVLLQDDEPACRAMVTSAGYKLFDWGQDTLCVSTTQPP